MEIMVTIMGIISTIFTFSNTYFAFRLNRTKLEMEQAEINRKKEAEEAEKNVHQSSIPSWIYAIP